MTTSYFTPQNTIMAANFEAENGNTNVDSYETAIRLAVTISARLISVNLC